MNETELLPHKLDSLIKSAFAGNVNSQDQLGKYFREGFYDAPPNHFSVDVKRGEK